MSAILDISGLSLSFQTEVGPARVLDQVDLRVNPGEIVGLVGESGCGKTTIARVILGTLPEGRTHIGSGTIRLDGVDMLQSGKAAQALRGQAVTFIPQDPFTSFNPFFRIGTQIRDLMRGRIPQTNGRPTLEEAVITMLEAVHLPDPRAILAKYPHQLSGGQRQRVMIAMALLPQPRLIIADEPTTALDVTIQAQILGLLRKLAAERGVSVLFSTHDLGAAWEICDRVIVLYAGQTIETASREEFFSSARHPYTRLLLASLPEPGRDAMGIPGEVPDPLSPPPGCRFNPRCPRSAANCQDIRPPLSEVAPGHLVACHYPVAEAGGHIHA